MRNDDELTILISGAGPVGLTVAALLASARTADRYRVHVIESGNLPRWNAGDTDLRVYALSRASQHIFERLGLWTSIVASRACPYEHMRVWEGRDPTSHASLHFDCADIGEPDLGHIVEDRLLRHVLATLLADRPRVTLSTGAAVTSVERGPQRVSVTLSSGETLHGSLLVAADGGDSAIRSLLGLPTVYRSYAQQAIVAHVATERPHEHTAWQRFLPGGPLALLPLEDGRSSVVWSLPEARADELMSATDESFVDALTDASGGVLGALTRVSRRARFPLQMMHAMRYCCSRGVLVGDAAHTVHPLAGQGMNLGLADAACLADEIENAIEGGRHPGDLGVLRRYERRRKAENLKTMLALDALHHLFRLPGWAGPLRAAGLRAVDAALPAKRLLMRQALGMDGGHTSRRPAMA